MFNAEWVRQKPANIIAFCSYDLIEHHIRFTLAKRRTELSKHDWYRATAMVVRDMLVERMLGTRAAFDRKDSKKLYYLSLEFLIGRSLENNLFNLGILDICREYLSENGMDLYPLFEEEPDAALGNGGLGRLAACFLDSLATMDMPGYAYGINYEFGIFRQQIRDGYQVEHPDAWQRETSPWLVARPEESCQIPVYGRIEYRPDRRGEYRQTWVDRRVLTGIRMICRSRVTAAARSTSCGCTQRRRPTNSTCRSLTRATT